MDRETRTHNILVRRARIRAASADLGVERRSDCGTGWPMCLGIPGKIVEVHDNAGLAMGTVDFGGVRRDVCLSYVQDQARLDDYVIVHVGFAISIVDEAEARRTFEVLREMSQLDELEWLDDVATASERTLPSR